MDLTIIVTLWMLGCVQGQFFEDRRCRCVCPNPASILNTTITRQIYTGNMPPNQCDCQGVVLPLLQKELDGKVHTFCTLCECSYQTRNTTVIMCVVFLILFIISIALLYMVGYTGLSYFINRSLESLNLFGKPERRPVRVDDRDFLREHRGEYARELQRALERERQFEEQREREREREREHQRERERLDSELENLLRPEPYF